MYAPSPSWRPRATSRSTSRSPRSRPRSRRRTFIGSARPSSRAAPVVDVAGLSSGQDFGLRSLGLVADPALARPALGRPDRVLGGRLAVLLDDRVYQRRDPSRIPRHEGPWGHLAPEHGCRRDDRTVADSRAGKDDRPLSDEDALAD